MPRAFTEQERESITERLLQEGQKHFALYGLRKTRIEELAEAVGISKGAFYHFFASKEALFMQVLAEAEKHFQAQVLAAIRQPGPTPQTRLYAALHKAFALWKNIPVLHTFSTADYERIARAIPPETLHEHLHSDRRFAAALIQQCKDEGIPVGISAEELDGLLHAIFFASLHEEDFGSGDLSRAINTLIKLTVAYCLGDATLTV
jgi:AcrR family transcriptional regulator